MANSVTDVIGTPRGFTIVNTVGAVITGGPAKSFTAQLKVTWAERRLESVAVTVTSRIG